MIEKQCDQQVTRPLAAVELRAAGGRALGCRAQRRMIDVGEGMLSTLLATKLHRPRPTSNLVARPRLTDRLDTGLRNGHRLFLVVAPAGYGKTTLVTDWLGKTGIPSAWLSLDEADNDPLRFFTYIVAALQKTFDPIQVA
jgi:hypothetical protein